MHDGLVHSCNAYFAQLAMKLGPEAMLDAAAALGISADAGRLARRGCARRCRRPATARATWWPRRCAWRAWPRRWPTAACSPSAHVEMRDETAAKCAVKRERLLSPRRRRDARRATCATACSRARAAALRSHPLRIAGKTGTAEVAGEASHSWFVGFAPYDAPARRRGGSRLPSSSRTPATAGRPPRSGRGEIVSRRGPPGW